MSSHPLHVNQLEDGELNQLFEDRSLKGRDGYARLHCARAASYRFTRRGDILKKMENTRFDLHLRYAAKIIKIYRQLSETISARFILIRRWPPPGAPKYAKDEISSWNASETQYPDKENLDCRLPNLAP
ncbi:unnamed protein product [Clavelina lepadiformis]|uniref:Uncharacterized protein n=1 Tax=Clavelina lepadiformis TaxID=159417 RepID=A0ABP0H512_CLALP